MLSPRLACPVGTALRGGGGGRPRGAGPPLLRGASGVRRCPSPGHPPSERANGVHHPRAVGTGGRVWGPGTVPRPARPVGAACSGGGGGPPPGGVSCHRCERCLVSDAVPLPPACPLRRVAGDPQPVCPRFGLWGLGTQHRPHSVRLCRPALLAVWLGEGPPQRGAFHCCEWRLMSGAPPLLTARPLGGLLGSTTDVLWVRACGCGGPTLSPWPASPVGAACRGGGGGLFPGDLACRCCEGRLVSGAVPPLAACPLGWAAGVPRPVCSGCGRCGRHAPAPAPQRAPLRAGVALSGGGGRASPGGTPSTVVRGV